MDHRGGRVAGPDGERAIEVGYDEERRAGRDESIEPRVDVASR
jgi:hypothetical protein